MQPSVQVLNPSIKVRFVGPPRQPVDARRSISLECEERCPQHRDAEMVEERGEPFLLPFPCGLSYARQRLGHVSRSCARRVLSWLAFPSVPALRSTGSAADRSALFAGFIATTAEFDFSCPFVGGYGSSPSRRGLRWFPIASQT